MVKWVTILQVIKHSVTVKSVTEQISPYIKELTDTKEEYDFIMERLPKFYVDHYNGKTEHIEAWDKEGNIHMNDGDQTSVEHPHTMDHETPYLLSIHNHPNRESEMQSNGDYGLQAEYNTKYGISVGFHGMVITKNGYPFDPEKCYDNGDQAYYNGDIAVSRRFYKVRKENPECIKAREDWLDDKIMGDEMDRRITAVFSKELKGWDTSELVEEQNQVFKDFDIPMTSYYVPVKKLYE